MNLTPIKNKYLFNTLTAKDMGIFTGTAAGWGNTHKVLTLKKFGEKIEYVSSTASSVTFEQPHLGSKKCLWLTFSTAINPTQVRSTVDSNITYDYGIQIKAKQKNEGVGAPYFQDVKWYGGLEYIALSSGLIPDVNLEHMEREIIRSIYLDKPLGIDAGARVDARRVYAGTYTNTGSNNAGFTVTFYNSSTGASSSTYVFLEGGTTYTMADMISDFNSDANVNTKLEMFKGNTATSFYVRSKASGDLFTLGTAVQCTIDSRHLEIRSKSYSTQFDLSFPESILTTAAHYEVKFDTTGIGATTGKVTMKSVSSGTATTTDVSTASLAALVTALDAITGLSSTGIGVYAYAWGDSTITGLDYDLLFNAAGTTCIGATTVLKSPDLIGSERYPYELFPDGVTAEFINNGGDAPLTMFSTATRPDPSTEYVKYIFKTMYPHGYILDDPGRNGSTSQEFEIVFPKSILTAAASLWDATDFMYDADDSAFTADSTWLVFLAYWSA